MITKKRLQEIRKNAAENLSEKIQLQFDEVVEKGIEMHEENNKLFAKLLN